MTSSLYLSNRPFPLRRTPVFKGKGLLTDEGSMGSKGVDYEGFFVT